MKKNLIMLLAFLAFGQLVFAQTDNAFENPLIKRDLLGDGSSTMLLLKATPADTTLYLPVDTTLEYQTVNLISILVGKELDKDQREKFPKLDISLSMGFEDVYGGNVSNADCSGFKNDLKKARYSRSFAFMDRYGMLPSCAGVFKWHMDMSGTYDTKVSGKMTFTRPKSQHVAGYCNGFEEAHVDRPLTIKANVKTGYPYKVSDYQGKTAHYEVLDPDSILVGKYDIVMNASPDREQVEYIQEDEICTIPRAKGGIYYVTMTAPWLSEEKVFELWVTDPYSQASSRKSVNVNFCLYDRRFDESTRAAWNYKGDSTPTYASNENCGAMMVGDHYSDVSEFSVSQTIEHMPSGWYLLTWPAYYQPATPKSLNLSDPVLARITANDSSVIVKHVYDGPDTSTDDDYVKVMTPASAKGAMNVLSGGYLNELKFQVKGDSILTIGASAPASSNIGAITALGTPTLKYYGKGFAYGDVTREDQDTIYTAAEEIKYNVQLHDGFGEVVPDTNAVVIQVFKGKELTEKNVILSNTIEAKKAGGYTISVTVPGAEEFENGEYGVLVTSLFDGNTYNAYMKDTISLSGGKSPVPTNLNSIPQEDKSSASYDLSGRRIADGTKQAGIVISKGVKSVRK